MSNPLEGLYDFVKSHLLIINAVVLSSSFLVGVLDFLAPTLSLLPRMVYTFTACLVVLMLVSAFAPAMLGRLISALGLALDRKHAGPLWRRPVWQVAMAILLGVTIVGFASVAKANQGGLIASGVPAVRSLQESLLGLHQDVADIKQGVDTANGKLDKLVGDSNDPQRELVSRGYTLYGLSQAIRQGDKRAVTLFAKIGYRSNSETDLAVLLNGDQPWDSELAAMLPKSMFEGNKQGCFRQGAMVIYEGKAPVPERIETLKRLCDTASLLQALEADAQRDAGTQPPNDYYRTRREARAKYLPMLKG